MWYAASEIFIFLIIALILGGVAGFAIAQTYTISLSRSQGKGRANAKTVRELTVARAQITELQRLVETNDDQSDSVGARLSQRVVEASDTPAAKTPGERPEAEAV